MFVFDGGFLERCRFLRDDRPQALCFFFQERYMAMAQELIKEIISEKRDATE